MFCLRSAILNIYRYRSRSVLVTLTCMAIVIFEFIYMHALESNRQQLLSISQSLPVTARILNLDGSMESGLYIPEGTIERIEQTGNVKDMLITTRLAAEFPSMPVEANELKPVAILGVNDIKALSDADDRRITLSDAANLDFLHGKEALCLAGESFLRRNRLNAGDTVDLKLFSIQFQNFSFGYESLGDCSLRIVGSISAPQTTAERSPIDIVCPLEWAREKIVQAGLEFQLDSAAFTVADPLRLNTFKAAMKEFLLSSNPQSGYSTYGNALTVRDETFISAAGRVKSTLNILNAFAPVVFAMIALVGYAMAFLLMQGRRVEIAIMRSLGASRRTCVAVMIIEYALLGLAGSLFGAACVVLRTGLGLETLLNIFLFLAGLMVGISAAAVQISRSNTMTGLVKVEA